MLVTLQPNTFTNLYSATGFTVGDQLAVRNRNGDDIRLYSTASTPTGADSFVRVENTLINSRGDEGAWAYSMTLSVIEVILVSGIQSGFSCPEIQLLRSLTTGFDDTGRLKVDSQQTSFERNLQYRFFDDRGIQYWHPTIPNNDARIPANRQLVYLFQATNAVNIQARIINGIAGARKYLVFPYDPDNLPTLTNAGATVDLTSQIYKVNGNKNQYIETLPESGVSVSATLCDAFTVANISQAPRTGTSYKTDGNNNRASSNYSASSNRAGVASNQGFYLVLFDEDGTNASDLLFTVEWEEEAQLTS